MHINLREDIEPVENVEKAELSGKAVEVPVDPPAVAGADVRELPTLKGDRLFQTHQRVEKSSRSYLKVLGVVLVLVALGAAVFFYVTLPSFGDRVLAPRGLELAVRNHFVDVQKRETNDIVFYYCDTFYWARVGVEKRPDITTNPVYLIDSYSARATQTGDETWSVTAAPIDSPEKDTPCR